MSEFENVAMKDENTENEGLFDFEDLDGFIDAYDGAIVEECEKGTCSATEALFKSLDTKGRIDFDYMSIVSGLGFEELVSGLSGVIYQDPRLWGEEEKGGWLLGSDYLSGNLIVKLDEANKANEKYNNRFEENIKALKGLLRPEIDSANIYVSLGSNWVPGRIYDEFLLHLVGCDSFKGRFPPAYVKFFEPEYSIRYDKDIQSWFIPFKTRFGRFLKARTAMYDTYGTYRKDMIYMLEDTMNMKTPKATKTQWVGGKEKSVIDKTETMKQIECQNRLRAEFEKWVWADEGRKNMLINAYMSKFGNIRCKVYDGSFLTFPGLNPKVTLFSYQKNAVARILFSKNTLLAHDVGAGKTYEIAAACMQLRRLNLSKKNMVVVPNSILCQWQSAWHYLYPDADLFVIDSSVYNIHTVGEVLDRIKNEDHDAILIASSCFDNINVGTEFLLDKYRKELVELNKADWFICQHSPQHRSKVKAIENKMKKLINKEGALVHGFEELGINSLFIDESHNYKNLNVETQIDGVAGFSNTGSEKCRNLYEKIRVVQNQNNGGRIVFATGTPITNSISDIYVIQKYLQSEELEALELATFDSWAAMFIEKSTELEIDVDTSSFRTRTRLSKFNNVPELADILSGIADFHSVENKEDLPEFDGYTDIICEGGPSFADYLSDISSRVEKIRHFAVDNKEDNMLKVTTDGRKAALDLRLVGVDTPDLYESKVRKCAEQVIKLWRETNGTQLVFCDSSTPKPEFNMYDELKRNLIELGMPADKIAFIHDADKDSVREKLFKKMRSGEVAVLIGSTAKMGVGVNVQDKLVAIHHLDLPWRPADMVQREGRLIRPGNQNDKVHIFRFITKSSFDAYSWQILEHKQKFIAQLLSGCVSERNTSDIDSTVLSYSEVKALAIGNPKIKKRCELVNELDRLKLLQRAYIEDLQAKLREKQSLPVQLEDYKRRAKKVEIDVKFLEAYGDYLSGFDVESKKALNADIYAGVQTYRNLPEDVKLGKFAGFDIIVPAHMVPRILSKDENNAVKVAVPYIYLRGAVDYSIDIESENGIFTKLSNYCFNRTVNKTDKETGETKQETYSSGIKNALEKLGQAITATKDRIEDLNHETLVPSREYLDKIDNLTAQLAEVDKEIQEEAERKAEEA